MLGGLAKAIFGSSNDRYVKSMMKIVDQINALEAEISAMDDDRLQGQTQIFRDRLAAGETLDDILPEAFATVREASQRVMGMRHFDVQMVGGIVLHRGEIAEMRTGEGKTLTETLACYLNAIEGKGVHVVTVNDYLARRDAEWMGRIYMVSLASARAWLCPTFPSMNAVPRMKATSHTQPTMSLVSIICATT